MEVKSIAIGCDHAGFPFKTSIVEMLEEKGITVHDFGTDTADSVDYPDFVHPVANSIGTGESQLGIIICGTGNGVAMTANKHPRIRAAVCWKEELAELARRHNDANVLALPARFVDQNLALSMVDAFLNAVFEGGRHARRVGKIDRKPG